MESPRTTSFVLSHGKERGVMLVVALLFLTLLTLLGVTFAALMKLEREAARNYVDSQTAEFVLHSAVDAVAAQLRGSDNYYHYTHPRAQWLFWDPRRKGELGAGRYLVEELKEEEIFFHGILEPVKGVARCAYRAKVFDTASQINLNCGTDNLAMMLENLGLILRRKSTQIHVNPFYADYPEKGNRVRGTDIVRYRRKLEGGRFTSKAQLAEIIGQNNFEILADFVTVHSWVNPNTGKPQDVTELVLRLDNEKGGRASSSNLTGVVYEDVGHPQVYGTQTVSIEPRAPINVNTASREVLAACFAGIACRRPFPFVERTAVRIGQEELRAGFAPEGGMEGFPGPARGGIGGSEEITYTIRPVWVYTPRITLNNAWLMANAVVRERRQRPFVAWQAGRRDAGGFAEFVNTRISKNMLPRPNGVVVIDPLIPRSKRFEGIIRANGSGLPAVSYLWGRGTDSQERNLRRQKGLAVNTDHNWFYETVRSGIIANFNPNTRLNRYGYNMGAALPVDKSCLVSPWLPDLQAPKRPSRSEVYVGYTTEFCFDSNGYYEVVALAELDERYDPSQGLKKPKVFRKARAVVKIFDVVQHTTQYDFAKQFRSRTGQFSSRRGRRTGRDNVMTYPQPLIAASDYISSGSRIDGSIQLMGESDANMLRLNSAAVRERYYQPMQNIRFYHPFMWRKAREESRFIQQARRGWSQGRVMLEGDVQVSGGVGRFEKDYTAVLDALFVRGNREFGYRYMDWPDRQGRNQVIRGQGGEEGGTLLRVLQWPRMSQTFLDGDNLRPDGLHTNIFNAPTRASGIAMFPASKLTLGSMSSWNVGEHGRFSLQGDIGNVEYYMGGIAFWIRFDFDASDPIFSGLVGCTQVVRDVGQGPQNSEGNQFYVFKTSFGELRVVRMYYHRAFGVPSMHGSNGLLPPPPSEDEAAAGFGGDKDKEIDVDVNKAFARSEVLVDISGWKAHEWHHVGVVWNDADPSPQRVRVYVDFQVAESVTGVRYGRLGEKDFVALNTKVPYDELTIGGIVRRQADPRSGLFKFSYNLRATPGRIGSGGGGYSGRGGIGGFVLPQLKVFPANGTIDEFFCFSGTFEAFFSTAANRSRGYFTTKPGRYHNMFQITLPQGAEAVRLRSFTWTEYQPPFYHGPRGNVVPVRDAPVRATVYVAGEPRRFPGAPWREVSGVARNRLGGVILRRPTGRGVANEPVEVVYEFDMVAARGTGNYGAVAVGTPIIDDVTLTYFLPSVEILSWEDLPVDYQALEGKRTRSGRAKTRVR